MKPLIVCLLNQYAVFGYNYTWITVNGWQLMVQKIWSSSVNVQRKKLFE